MSWEQSRRLVQLMDELAENLAIATMCAEEIRAVAYAKLHGNRPGWDQSRDGLFEGLLPNEASARGRTATDRTHTLAKSEGESYSAKVVSNSANWSWVSTWLSRVS